VPNGIGERSLLENGAAQVDVSLRIVGPDPQCPTIVFNHEGNSNHLTTFLS